MLIDFTVSNFRSIKEPQTLSMLATKAGENPDNVIKVDDSLRVLKTAVIYGANGSGKSNVIKALNAFKSLLRHSSILMPRDRIEQYQPFKLDKSCLDKPTVIEIEFSDINNIRYKYTVKFNDHEIINESLFFYPKNKEAKLFIREKGKAIDSGDSLKGAKLSIEKQLLPNQLFISKAANNNHEQLGRIYRTLLAVGGISILDKSDYTSPIAKTILTIIDTGDIFDQVGTLLKNADTGIEKTYLKEEKIRFKDVSATNDSDESSPEIRTSHKMYDGEKEIGTTAFNLYEESEGTQKLFDLGGAILFLMSSGQTVIIDELNNSFHPLITEMLIKLFHNPKTNPKNAQLIFTTHDTSIFKPELFRRDQIWFTEKDKYGATSLYSLSEFKFDKVRSNVPFDKWYLSGRFGALPLIKDFNFSGDAEAKEGE